MYTHTHNTHIQTFTHTHTNICTHTHTHAHTHTQHSEHVLCHSNASFLKGHASYTDLENVKNDYMYIVEKGAYTAL